MMIRLAPLMDAPPCRQMPALRAACFQRRRRHFGFSPPFRRHYFRHAIFAAARAAPRHAATLVRGCDAIRRHFACPRFAAMNAVAISYYFIHIFFDFRLRPR